MTTLINPPHSPADFVVPVFIEALRQQSFYYYKLAADLKKNNQPRKVEFDLHRQYHHAAVKMYAEWLKYCKSKEA